MTRLKCILFGCAIGEYGECTRCGASQYPYEHPGYVAYGLLFPLTHRWWLLTKWWRRHRPGRRCEVCGRRMWKPDGTFTCSKKCFYESLPF